MNKKRTKFLLLCATFCIALPGALAASLCEQGQDAEFHRNYDDAIDLYKRSMQSEPDHAAVAASKLFHTYRVLHRYDDAAEALRDIIKLSGNDHYTLELAALYQSAGKHYDAQKLYQEALSHNPDDGEALYGMGVSLEATGNYDAAKDYYSRAAGGGGSYVDAARRHLARTNKATPTVSIDADQEIGRWDKSQMPLKVFVEDGSESKGYKPQCRQYVVDAVRAWNSAGHGLVEMQIVGESDKSEMVVSWVPSLQSALGMMVPEKNDDDAMRRAHIYLATAVDSTGRPLPAESPATATLYDARDRMLKEVTLHEFGHALGLKHSPRTDDIMADGVFGLNSEDVPSARTLQVGDVERLRALYSTAIAQGKTGAQDATTDGGNVSGREGAGATVVMSANATPGAHRANGGRTQIPAPSVAVSGQRQIDPSAAAVKAALANISMGQYQSAIDTLESVINRNPRNVQAHYLIAVAHVNLRHYEQAEQHYREVLKLMPTGKLADLATTGLQRINH